MHKQILALALCIAGSAFAQTAMDCPMHDQHEKHADHYAGVDSRGDDAMGFSHETTTHHFTLLADGGVIEVNTKAEHDDATRDQIRMHLTHITTMFSNGDFSIPMFVHDQLPPGVPVMKAKRASISYAFEPTERGGQVRIVTHDPEALKAIHEFLLFQIQDHRTGDSAEVKGFSR